MKSGKVQIAAMAPEKAVRRAGSRDSRRNAVGVIPASTIESFAQAVVDRMRFIGVPCDWYIKRIGLSESYRIDLYRCAISDEVHALDPKRHSDQIGFFIERRDGRDEAEVWIYFTVRRKALTRFRRWCMNVLFEIVPAAAGRRDHNGASAV